MCNRLMNVRKPLNLAEGTVQEGIESTTLPNSQRDNHFKNNS